MNDDYQGFGPVKGVETIISEEYEGFAPREEEWI